MLEEVNRFAVHGVIEQWPQGHEDHPLKPDLFSLSDDASTEMQSQLEAAWEQWEAWSTIADAELSSMFDDWDNPPMIAYEPFSSFGTSDEQIRRYSVTKNDMRTKDLSRFVVGWPPSIGGVAIPGWWMRASAAFVYGEPRVYGLHYGKRRFYYLHQRGPIVVAERA